MKTSRRTQNFRWFAIVASVATMALALTGFGSALASGGATASKARAAKSVRIQGFAYHGATTRVKAGTRVTFSNMDRAPHTATGRGFNTGTIAPGGKKSVTFKRKGTFRYHCTIHPDMHGKVIVG
jgi:plastocyanin